MTVSVMPRIGRSVPALRSSGKGELEELRVRCPVLQEEVRKIAGELMATRRRLSEIAQSLSEPEREELRSLIDGIVADHLTPSIEELLSASKD